MHKLRAHRKESGRPSGEDAQSSRRKDRARRMTDYVQWKLEEDQGVVKRSKEAPVRDPEG